jgi:replication-associated recombination protein RarA
MGKRKVEDQTEMFKTEKSDRFEVFTQNKYRLDEVASALQKSIRRGLEEDALYWALELFPKFHNYLWKRLLVVAVEDIESYNAGVVINSFHQAFKSCNDKGDHIRHRIFLTKAILYLCRAKKSRESDHFQHYIDVLKTREKEKGEKRQIPDYAIDVHTQKGRDEGMTKEEFMINEQRDLVDKGEDKYFNLLVTS